MPLLTNPDGSRLVVYRGEYGDEHTATFKTYHPCLYFGTAEVASYYALHHRCAGNEAINSRVYPVYLQMDKPFINQPKDAYLELVELEERLGIAEAKRIAVKFEPWIVVTDQWTTRLNVNKEYTGVADYLHRNPQSLNELYFQAYPFFADRKEIRRLKQLGYDGAIHAGNGSGSEGTVEYCIFDRKQAISIFQEVVDVRHAENINR